MKNGKYKFDMNKMLGFRLVANDHKSVGIYSAKIGAKPGVKL